jgi:hypothetical protein
MFSETAGRTLEEIGAVFAAGDAFAAWKTSDCSLGRNTVAEVRDVDQGSEELIEKTKSPQALQTVRILGRLYVADDGECKSSNQRTYIYSEIMKTARQLMHV